MHPTVSIAALAAVVVAAAASPIARAAEPQGDLQGAFAAAFGAPAPVSRTVQRAGHPPGSVTFGGAPMTVTLTVTPKALTPLGHERYALVAFETDELGAHVDPGAIAIAYVRRTPVGWRLDKLWNEVTWSGNTGRPADRVSVRDLGSGPLVIANSSWVGQGQTVVTDWIIALRPDAPHLLGHVPAAGALDPEGYTVPDTYSFDATLEPPRKPGEVLTVQYKGWTAPPGRLDPKRWFSITTSYSERNGELVPDKELRLPGG